MNNRHNSDDGAWVAGVALICVAVASIAACVGIYDYTVWYMSGGGWLEVIYGTRAR